MLRHWTSTTSDRERSTSTVTNSDTAPRFTTSTAPVWAGGRGTCFLLTRLRGTVLNQKPHPRREEIASISIPQLLPRGETVLCLGYLKVFPDNPAGVHARFQTVQGLVHSHFGAGHEEVFRHHALSAEQVFGFPQIVLQECLVREVERLLLFRSRRIDLAIE